MGRPLWGVWAAKVVVSPCLFIPEDLGACTKLSSSEKAMRHGRRSGLPEGGLRGGTGNLVGVVEPGCPDLDAHRDARQTTDWAQMG